jgi:hypothetical protein
MAALDSSDASGSTGDQSPRRLLRRSLIAPTAQEQQQQQQQEAQQQASEGDVAGGPSLPYTPGATPELYRSDRAALVAELDLQLRKSARLKAELQQAKVGGWGAPAGSPHQPSQAARGRPAGLHPAGLARR